MRGVAGAPRSVTPDCAAWIFAGSTAIRKRINAKAATRRVRGTSRPIAPRISQTPVNETMSSGLGTIGGTIRTMSARMLLKWAAAVKQKITARPSRVAVAQSRNDAAPSWPTSRASKVTTTRTINGAMIPSEFGVSLNDQATRSQRQRRAAGCSQATHRMQQMAPILQLSGVQRDQKKHESIAQQDSSDEQGEPKTLDHPNRAP